MNERNSYRPTSFSSGKLYNERTTKFVGVDLTSPQMEVALKRGVYSNNYVMKKNNKVETRFGYEVISKDNILNAWEVVLDDGERHLICAIRSGDIVDSECDYYLCECELDGNHVEILSYIGESQVAKDCKVWATTSNNKLWVLDGYSFQVVYAELYLGEWSVRSSLVEEWSGTHIPTVCYMNVATNADIIPSVTNITLEYPNLLSKYVKDMILTGIDLKEGELFPRFKLSQKVVDIDSATLEYLNPLKSANTLNLYVVTLTHSVSITDVSDTDTFTADQIAFMESILIANKKVLIGNTPSAWNTYITDALLNNDGKYPAVVDHGGYYVPVNQYTQVNSAAITTQHQEPSGSYLQMKIYGVIDGDSIVLFSNPKAVAMGQPNLTVKYQYVNATEFEENANFVGKNTFGAKFGKNNSLNRLWLAGNPDKPNYVVHSQEPFKGFDASPTKAEGDFSYFPDEGLIKFGEAENAVIGMIPLSSDKMMILKNKSGNERTMYFVTPYDVSDVVAKAGTYGTLTITSDLTITREEYSTSMSNTGTAGYTKETVDNFNGDTLFLSDEHQIVGLDIEGITGDSQRVATTRSRFIDKRLMESDMENANLFHAGNYLFFSIKGALYVSASKSTDEDSYNQYEWWPCDPIQGTVIGASALHDGTVIIFTKEGVTYRFKEDPSERVDIDRYFISINDNLAINSGDDQITVASSFASKLVTVANKDTADEDDLWELKYKQDKTVSTISNKKVCMGILTVNASYDSVTGGYAFSDDFIDFMAAQGCNFITYSALADTDPLFIKFDDTGNITNNYRKIYIAKTLEGVSASLRALLYMVVPEEKVYGFCADAENGKVALYMKDQNDAWKLLDLAVYDSSIMTYCNLDGCFENHKKVTPFFASLRLTQGKLGYDKTIQNVTIWNDSNNPCELYVGMLTNKQSHIHYSHSQNVVLDSGIGFDWESMDFTDTSFDKNSVPKFYNFKRFLRSQQSFTICFTAKSKRNSVLGGINIDYRVKEAKNKK